MRLPWLDVWQQEEEAPENLALKASEAWLQEFHRIGANKNSTLGGHIQGLMCTRTQGIKQGPQSVAEVPVLWLPDAKSQCTGTSHSNFPLFLRKIEGSRRGWHWLRWLVSITDSVDRHLNTLQVVVEDRGAGCAIVRGAVKSRARLSSWTEQHKRLG